VTVSILDVRFDIFSASWGLDDAVTIATSLPEPAKSLVEERVAAWRPHQGAFKKRRWFQQAGDHSRSKQIQLEQAGVLRGYRDAATGMWQGPADDLFRMQIRNMILSATGAAKRRPEPNLAGLRHQKPRPRSRPRTEAELRGLRTGNEKRRLEAMRRREEAARADRRRESQHDAG
jgi:hypothetical protein